jgi:hypothetical protein
MLTTILFLAIHTACLPTLSTSFDDPWVKKDHRHSIPADGVASYDDPWVQKSRQDERAGEVTQLVQRKESTDAAKPTQLVQRKESTDAAHKEKSRDPSEAATDEDDDAETSGTDLLEESLSTPLTERVQELESSEDEIQEDLAEGMQLRKGFSGRSAKYSTYKSKYKGFKVFKIGKGSYKTRYYGSHGYNGFRRTHYGRHYYIYGIDGYPYGYHRYGHGRHYGEPPEPFEPPSDAKDDLPRSAGNKSVVMFVIKESDGSVSKLNATYDRIGSYLWTESAFHSTRMKIQECCPTANTFQECPATCRTKYLKLFMEQASDSARVTQPHAVADLQARDKLSFESNDIPHTSDSEKYGWVEVGGTNHEEAAAALTAALNDGHSLPVGVPGQAVMLDSPAARNSAKAPLLLGAVVVALSALL